MTLPGERVTPLEAARSYRARGLYPIPLCVPREGGGCNAHETCSKPGKVPAAKEWGALEPDDAQLRAWFAQPRNVGLALRGMVAFDLDSADGERELERAAAVLGPLPPTWENASGRGRHLIYRFPEGVDDTHVKGSLASIGLRDGVFVTVEVCEEGSFDLASNTFTNGKHSTGLDLRAGSRAKSSGQIAVAPSVHVSGRRYVTRDNDLDAPAVLPLAWFNALPRKVAPALPRETSKTAGQREGGSLFSGSRDVTAHASTDPKRYAAALASALPSMLASIPRETPDSPTNDTIRDVALRAFRLALGAGEDTVNRTVEAVTSAGLASGHPSNDVHNTIRSSLEAARREGPATLSERARPEPSRATTTSTRDNDLDAPELATRDPVVTLADTIGRYAWGAPTASGGTVAAALRARIARRVSGEEKPLVTPWASLNDAMGRGFWPGLHVIVGSTGTGKSQFAMQLAMGATPEARVPVMYLALELDALGLYARAAALVCHGRLVSDTGEPLRVSWSDFYTGRVEVPPWCDDELASVPLHWTEAPPHGFRYDGIAPHVAALRALYPDHHGPVVLVVDFLQLVAGTNPREDLRERIGKASYACRAAAREHDAVVLALSSTSREGSRMARVDGSRADGPSDDGEGKRGQFRAAEDESTDAKRPPLYDLVGLGKESGDVEYSADSVLTFCPESWPDGATPPPGGKRIHVAVAKIRAGAPSWCVLAFDGTRFTEPPASEAPPPERIPGKGKTPKGKGARYGRGRGPGESPATEPPAWDDPNGWKTPTNGAPE